MRGVVKIALVALAVLILAGLFLAWVPRARESANRLRCQENERQVGWFALWDYTDRPTVFGGKDRPKQLGDIRPAAAALFPPGTVPNAELPPEERQSLYVILLPHFGQADLAQRFDPKLPWGAGPNRAAACTPLTVLVCPSYHRPAQPDEPAPTYYVGNAGLGPDAARLPVDDPRA